MSQKGGNEPLAGMEKTQMWAGAEFMGIHDQVLVSVTR